MVVFTSTKMLTWEAVRVLKEVNKTLETILTQMQERAITLPEYNTVRAMNGVGDVRRFHNGGLPLLKLTHRRFSQEALQAHDVGIFTTSENRLRSDETP